MPITLDDITAAFDGLSEENQLSLIAHLVERLPDDLHDELCNGLDDAARTLGLAIAADNDLDDDQADIWASDFASNLLCAESDLSAKSRATASRAMRIQRGLDYIERRRAMLNPKVAA